MSLPLNPFAAAAARAVGAALELDPSLFAVTSPPKPELGDFAVGCFPAAKAKRSAPPKLAAEVAAAFTPTDMLASATAAGPFVNFKANRAAVYRYLFERTDKDDFVPTDIGAGKTVCVDYSSPNISKHLAYHHIRSTVIGHALCNLYRAVGYRVVGINHLGDWGTTHGMLLAAQDMWGTPEPLTIDALNEIYVKFRAAEKDDASLTESARAWFKKLEDGDADARAVWQKFKDVSWAEFEIAYQQLGITFEEVKGESEFEDAMPEVLDMLADKGLSVESQGALVVDLEADDMPPLLLKKQDGATLYATRDLAAAMYRHRTYDFERSLYVVGRGQSLHFKQLFNVLGKMGFEWADKNEHIAFGLVRIGGQKAGSRKGNVVYLRDVLREASERARERVKDKNPDMPDDVLAETAEAVGIGAVVFANLVSQMNKDIDFEWEDVLSTDGDTGIYVQYSYARSCKMIEKGEAEFDPDTDPTPLTSDFEWAEALQLLGFADVVAKAADSNEPHLLTRYLLDLAAKFSRWYNAGNDDKLARVLVDDKPTRAARLALVAAHRRVVEQGLGILGLRSPRAM